MPEIFVMIENADTGRRSRVSKRSFETTWGAMGWSLVPEEVLELEKEAERAAKSNESVVAQKMADEGLIPEDPHAGEIKEVETRSLADGPDTDSDVDPGGVHN